MLARLKADTGFDPATQRMVLVARALCELIRRILAAYNDVVVVITGAPDERAEAEALAATCGPRCFSFAGKTALAELPALYSHAAAMVTRRLRAVSFRRRDRAADLGAVRP